MSFERRINLVSLSGVLSIVVVEALMVAHIVGPLFTIVFNAIAAILGVFATAAMARWAE